LYIKDLRMDGSRNSVKSDRLVFGTSAATKDDVPLILFRSPAYLARRFQQVCVAIVSESLAKDGLSQFQWAVLSCIDHRPGIDQRRLAEAVGIAPVNAGEIIDQLGAMQIVERRLNGKDRRVRELFLTARGTKLRRRLLPENTLTNARILAPLAPEERKTLTDLLVRVIEGNAAYARPGAGRRKRGSGGQGRACAVEEFAATSTAKAFRHGQSNGPSRFGRRHERRGREVEPSTRQSIGQADDRRDRGCEGEGSRRGGH
jgi:DNA-binding MarR family transcriptional regulator